MVGIKSLLDLLAYAAALLGTAPLYLYLDAPAQLLLPVALTAAVIAERRGRRLLSSGMATVLSIACFLLYAAQISRDHLIEPVVNILALLLAARLATQKSGRNYLQIFVLAVFALASSSLLTLSVAFFFYLVLLVIVVTVGLVLLSFHAADERLVLDRKETGRVLGVALILPAASLVLMLVFFVILPRTQYPLWNFLNPAATATAGFTDKVEPGSVAGIAAAKEVSFRVEVAALPAEELYWRGIVLNAPRGNTWVRQPPPTGAVERVVGGSLTTQTIYPEPRQERYLFALDPPRAIEGLRADQASDFTFRAHRPLSQRVGYRVDSFPGGVIEASKPVDRAFYLAVPEGLSERVRGIVGRIDAGGGAAEKIARIEAFFTTQKLSYANDDLPSSRDPVDEFLFEKKRGYCEFFASSFALLLRLSGVPARLVGGYYGGEYNELGGYYVVTEDRAHVWVEALVENRWVRIDPSRLAQNADASLLAPRRRGLSAARRLLDALDYYWNRAVIAYDLGQQLRLLRQSNQQLRRFKAPLDLKAVLSYALGAIAGVAVLFALFRRLRTGREERLLRGFLRQARRIHGLEEISTSVGLWELARRLDDPLCREFAEIYGRAIYRDRKLSAPEIEQLRKLIRRLKKTPEAGHAGP